MSRAALYLGRASNVPNLHPTGLIVWLSTVWLVIVVTAVPSNAAPVFNELFVGLSGPGISAATNHDSLGLVDSTGGVTFSLDIADLTAAPRTAVLNRFNEHGWKATYQDGSHGNRSS